MKANGSLTALVLSLAAALFLFGCAGPSDGESGSADGYPEQPIELIVPFAAGGPTDSLARALAKAAEPELGETMVVVNRPAAGGTVAATEVANAEPDGYKVLVPTEAIMAAQPVLREVQYSIDDFRGITGLVEQPYILSVNANSQWQTLDDLANADERIEYAVPGIGGYPHIAQAAFFDQAGVQAEAIPFDGNAPAQQALLGGQVDTAALEPSVVKPQIDAGKAKGLAVTSPERLDILPNVPTFRERGHDNATFIQNWSLLVPSGTPDEHVEVLQKAVKEAVKSQEYQNFIKDNYMTPWLVDGKQVIETMKSRQDKIDRLYEELDIQAS